MGGVARFSRSPGPSSRSACLPGSVREWARVGRWRRGPGFRRGAMGGSPRRTHTSSLRVSGMPGSRHWHWASRRGRGAVPPPRVPSARRRPVFATGGGDIGSGFGLAAQKSAGARGDVERRRRGRSPRRLLARAWPIAHRMPTVSAAKAVRAPARAVGSSRAVRSWCRSRRQSASQSGFVACGITRPAGSTACPISSLATYFVWRERAQSTRSSNRRRCCLRVSKRGPLTE